MFNSSSFIIESESRQSTAGPSEDIDWSSEGYFAALLSAVQTIDPDIPLDPIILQSILLCLIAPGGTKNLLLRARDEDIALVQNIASVILIKVFGFSTQKVRSRSKQSSSELLHSLFLYDKSSSKRRQMRLKSGRSFNRSSSDPSEYLYTDGENKEWGGISSIRQGTADLSQRRPRPRLVETQTDQWPQMPKDFEFASSSHGTANDQFPLPKAVVFSGLEHSTSAQRALLQVLAEKRVASEDEGDEVYVLPDDFMVVYVCPIDPRERPKIHTALLDRFAMSVSVSPSASTRQAYVCFRSELHMSLSTPDPIISPADIAYLRSLTVHLHPSLSLYVNDLFTAARHHHELDGTLLTTRCHKDAEALIRAQRLLCGDSTSTQLIRSTKTRTSEDISNDSQSGLDEVHNNMESLEDRRERKDLRGKEKEFGIPEDSFLWQLPGDTRMDASEVDVAKIVPRVISHRLRVRDGPDQEIFSSAIYPAALPNSQKAEKHRKTVKEIIVQVLVDT